MLTDLENFMHLYQNRGIAIVDQKK